MSLDGGNNFPVGYVDPGATLSLSGLTLTNGRSYYADGGGLVNQGFTTSRGCTISDNTALYGRGGGLWNDYYSDLTLEPVS